MGNGNSRQSQFVFATSDSLLHLVNASDLHETAAKKWNDIYSVRSISPDGTKIMSIEQLELRIESSGF